MTLAARAAACAMWPPQSVCCKPGPKIGRFGEETRTASGSFSEHHCDIGCAGAMGFLSAVPGPRAAVGGFRNTLSHTLRHCEMRAWMYAEDGAVEIAYDIRKG